MHICLTDEKHNTVVTIEAGVILTARRSPENQLITQVITAVMGPNGPMSLSVRESPVEVSRRVNAAMRAQGSEFRLDAAESLLGFENN